MQRKLFDYFIIALKGMAMGAADAVPGVSGGTIAFISGIYEELISAINQINFSLIKTFKNEGIKGVWRQINGNFLASLFIGILVSFASFMSLAKYLLENQPILIWSFFFGLVIASIVFIASQIKQWNFKIILALTVGAFIAYYITTIPTLGNNDSDLYLFIAASIAICAMILPGISGSFILVLLGAYHTLSTAMHDFDFKKIIIFVVGAIVGLLSFSKILKWLFSNFKNITLATLTGFIIGSLPIIWPWKEILTTRLDTKGNIIPILTQPISPNRFEIINNIDSQLIYAIGLMIIGFLTIFILEKIGSKKEV